MGKQKEFGRSRPSIAYELDFRRAVEAVNKEIQEDVQEAVQNYLGKGKAEDAGIKTLAQIFKELRLKWYKRYEVIGKDAVRKLMRRTDKRTKEQIRRKLKEIGWSMSTDYDETDKALMAELTKEGVSLIKSIPQQYLRKVQNAVNEGMIAGGDEEKIYNSIRELNQVSDRRAALIARDQNNKATQNFAIANARKLGATKGKWIHVSGKYSSRISHIHMDGQIFDLQKGLYDEAAKKFVKPGELCYCNCQFAVLLPGFDA